MWVADLEMRWHVVAGSEAQGSKDQACRAGGSQILNSCRAENGTRVAWRKSMPCDFEGKLSGAPP
jgi:hypothetical protein